jgi:DSF synthase
MCLADSVVGLTPVRMAPTDGKILLTGDCSPRIEIAHQPSYDPRSHPIVFQSTSLTVTLDEKRKVAWNEWHPMPRPCVTHALLCDFRTVYAQIASGQVDADYCVTWSSHPEAFSLGGDLDLFRRCVRQGDWGLLQEYADLCVDAIYSHVCGFGRGVTSIALVQGAALGGGWETVLAMDYAFAEEQAEFGLPEMIFNLFPGMGAYSLLARKIGPQKAEKLITEGKTHSAHVLRSLELVEQVSPAGGGLPAVLQFIEKRQKQLRGLQAFARAKRLAATEIAKQELTDIVREWVRSARELTARDLRVMELLVQAQLRLKAMGSTGHHPRPEMAPEANEGALAVQRSA